CLPLGSVCMFELVEKFLSRRLGLGVSRCGHQKDREQYEDRSPQDVAHLTEPSRQGRSLPARRAVSLLVAEIKFRHGSGLGQPSHSAPQRSLIAGLATTATRAVLRRMFHLKVEAIALRSFDEKIL